jgi:hypothetical protein
MYKTRRQKYIVSGFTFRVLYFWKYKSTIKYKFNPDKMHPNVVPFLSGKSLRRDFNTQSGFTWSVVLFLRGKIYC